MSTVKERIGARAAKVQFARQTTKSSLPPGDGLNPATREKILLGSVVAVSRQGTKKLAMGDICDAAGVSRGTLYRYFATKEDVLNAMSEHVSSTFENGVIAVAQQFDDPVDILRAVLDFHFSQTRQSARVLEIEPTYVMTFLRDHFSRHVNAIKTALAAVFDYVERRSELSIDRDLISQVLIRIELSTLLVPADRAWNTLPEVLPELFQSLVVEAKKPRAGASR